MKTITDLKQIIPGTTYPAYVKVEEKDGLVVEFHLNSFYVGMYCAIHVNGKLAHQSGDRNNKGLIGSLKKDLKAAFARGASVDFSNVRMCQTTMN